MKLDLKSFEILEKKIQRTVDLVTRLKDENRSLKARLADLEETASTQERKAKDFESMRVGQEQLERELKQLQEERRTVLARVDGLLENLDRLQLDAD